MYIFMSHVFNVYYYIYVCVYVHVYIYSFLNCPFTISSYPDYIPIFIEALRLWYHYPFVTTPVLKLMAELSSNRLHMYTSMGSIIHKYVVLSMLLCSFD